MTESISGQHEFSLETENSNISQIERISNLLFALVLLVLLFRDLPGIGIFALKDSKIKDLDEYDG